MFRRFGISTKGKRICKICWIMTEKSNTSVCGRIFSKIQYFTKTFLSIILYQYFVFVKIIFVQNFVIFLYKSNYIYWFILMLTSWIMLIITIMLFTIYFLSNRLVISMCNLTLMLNFFHNKAICVQFAYYINKFDMYICSIKIFFRSVSLI